MNLRLWDHQQMQQREMAPFSQPSLSIFSGCPEDIMFKQFHRDSFFHFFSPQDCLCKHLPGDGLDMKSKVSMLGILRAKS